MSDPWARVVGYFWRPELPWALGFTLALALILLRFRQGERRVILNTLEFYALCLLGKFVSAWIEALGFHTGAEILHEVFVVGSGLAMIHLTGLFLFRLFFPLLRLRFPRILEDLLIFGGYITWILVRLRLAGMDPSSLFATSAVITAVIAFSMQDTLGNTMGGLLLQLENSINLGDWISVAGVSGRIIEIRWRYTAIETRDGETVIFPNSFLMKNQFTLVSSRTQELPESRRWIWFNVHYSVPPARVIEVAEAVATNTDIPNVARNPPPGCVLMEFGPGYGRYALRYWLLDPRPDTPTDSQVRVHLFAAFQRAAIRFAIAEHGVHMVMDSDERREQHKLREFERRRAVLQSVELFVGLTQDELGVLAEHLVYVPFAGGDVIARQGELAQWLYLLVEGEVDVWFESPGQPRRYLATLGPGDVFGEMGLMTGEPRRATLIAKTYAQCYRLEKAAFEQVLHARPQIAEEISKILAAREQQLVRVQEDAVSRGPMDLTVRSQSILHKMRRIFGFK